MRGECGSASDSFLLFDLGVWSRNEVVRVDRLRKVGPPALRPTLAEMRNRHAHGNRPTQVGPPPERTLAGPNSQVRFAAAGRSTRGW